MKFPKKKSSEEIPEEETRMDKPDETAEGPPEDAADSSGVQIEDAPAAPDYEKQYAEMFDRYQRTLAEFDNFRKRTSKEKAVMYDDGVRAMAEKLLPVLDNFERALSATAEKEGSFYQGITMISRQLETALADMGVEKITALDEGFDPNLHYAVAHIEDENYGAGIVTEEMQKGYKHKDKIIRPSMVKVAN